jgi:hypothetical protein
MTDVTPSGRQRSVREIIGAPLQHLATWWSDVRERYRLGNEFATLDRQGQLDGVLRDAGVSRSSMRAILHAHPDAPRRLSAMLQRLGLTRRNLRDSGTLQDVELTCTMCEATGDCRHWLKSSATSGHQEFCPNAETFEHVREAPPKA